MWKSCVPPTPKALGAGTRRRRRFLQATPTAHLTRTECHSESAPNAAQLDSEFSSKKAAESESERGALRVAAEVVSNAMKQALFGRGFSVGRRKARRNSGVEERKLA